MEIGYQYLGLAAIGFCTLAWGLRVAHSLRTPYDAVASLVALAGGVALVVGALLTAVPNFFRS